MTKDNRHFEHADGTPFLWLGDTWWKGLCKRLTWEGFKELTADRKKKGFNVVQIVCGTYPDERGLLQPSWENEGGMPYLKKDFSEMNPDYFNQADRRIKHLVEAGIVPAITAGWGRAVNLNAVGLPGYKRQKRGETVTLSEIKVGESCSGKLQPTGAVFTLKTGANWLTIKADGSYSGTPGDGNAGRNSFLISVQKPDRTETLIELTVNVLGANGEIFIESFGGYKGTQNATQTTTGLNVAHDGKVLGWTGSGRGVMHAVDRSFKGGEVTPSDWAIMIFDDNVITSAEIDANTTGTTYRVGFETSPAVYSQKTQATQATDTLRIDVLRNDGSVLKSFKHAPGTWKGRTEFSEAGFDYTGDGSGSLRLRIAAEGASKSGRFAGAIDDLIIRKGK